ncbi:MAG: sugar transferase [Campylobacterales bacterium]|nr:sugar transferase [Campylobacterales bacterium]
MIILGRKYKFTDLEHVRLTQKFQHIDIIRCRAIESDVILHELQNSLKKSQSKLIVLNTTDTIHDDIIKYLTGLQFENGTKAKIITIENFLETYLHKCYIPDEHNDLHFLQDIKPFTMWQIFQKRSIDYFGIFCLILFSWPIMLFSMIKIKKQSPGPVFFQQKRMGYMNKEFICYKFRSMRIDAEKNGAQFASHNDPRVFPWGETMRKARFDELPQILNILKGEMHLIGPRPERKYWTDQFESQIPYYSERHLIKPGITGWAQVMYPYGENAEDAKQKLMYDLYYIKHWNIILEFKVIWKTYIVVTRRKGI